MTDGAVQGFAALQRRDWDAARSLLEQAVAETDVAEAELLDGLAEARWWCGDLHGAIDARERAVISWSGRHEHLKAVRAAVWLAIEYGNGLGHDPAARGWLARAESLGRGTDVEEVAGGWVAVGRAALASDPMRQLRSAEQALDVGRRCDDRELEISALARVGWAKVVCGAVDEGISFFDEAMAAGTAAEFDRLSTLGDLCCQLARATEAIGEPGRLGQWLSVVQAFNRDHRYPPLVGFCATCCAELQSGAGNWPGAEAHLRQAIEQLHGTGHRARCGPPAAKLAELLVLQGRLEEARDLLGTDDADDTLVARARLALANGQPEAAQSLAERWIRRRGDDLLAIGALLVAADATLAREDDAGTRSLIRRIAVADRTENRRAAGAAAMVEGQLALAKADDDLAIRAFERALDHYVGLEGLIEVARVHLGLAQASRRTRPEVARVEAGIALAGFEAAGATRLADIARAALRELGDRTHVGRKGTGLLTDRELEVLRLVAQGLTNAEIADRLFISVKTAGNHVSHILTKVGARSRTEAAAFAALHPEVLATTG